MATVCAAYRDDQELLRDFLGKLTLQHCDIVGESGNVVRFCEEPETLKWILEKMVDELAPAAIAQLVAKAQHFPTAKIVVVVAYTNTESALLLTQMERTLVSYYGVVPLLCPVVIPLPHTITVGDWFRDKVDDLILRIKQKQVAHPSMLLYENASGVHLV